MQNESEDISWQDPAEDQEAAALEAVAEVAALAVEVAAVASAADTVPEDLADPDPVDLAALTTDLTTIITIFITDRSLAGAGHSLATDMEEDASAV